MPVYQCSFQRGLLTEQMKTKMAAAIIDAHVDATGAPRIFVHTFLTNCR